MPHRKDRLRRDLTIHVRVSTDEKQRIERVANAKFLDTSTWMRVAALKAVDKWDHKHGAENSVLSPVLTPPTK